MSKRQIKSTGKSFVNYADNVMKPINCVVAFVELLFTAGVLCGRSLWIQIASFVLMVIVLIIYFGSYIYWMLYAPNRLQSEGYNLEFLELNALSETKDSTINIENQKTNIDVPENS